MEVFGELNVHLVLLYSVYGLDTELARRRASDDVGISLP